MTNLEIVTRWPLIQFQDTVSQGRIYLAEPGMLVNVYSIGPVLVKARTITGVVGWTPNLGDFNLYQGYRACEILDPSTPFKKPMFVPSEELSEATEAEPKPESIVVSDE